MIAAIVAALLSMAAVAWSGRDVMPPAGAPVEVLTSDPIRVQVSEVPTASEIALGIVASLELRADRAGNPATEEHLRRILGDERYVRTLALDAVDALGDGAVALAFAVYRLDVSGTGVTIHASTIEILPESRSLGLSIAHEDGHALINDFVALACGPDFVRRALLTESSPSNLAASVVDRLEAIGGEAHDAYHESIDEDRRLGHERRARIAAEAATATACP